MIKINEQNINITLPNGLVKQINRVVENAGLGYESESEFFKEAARILLRNLAEYHHFKKSQRNRSWFSYL